MLKRSILFIATSFGIFGCSPEPQDPQVDAAYGRSLFAAQCAQCHGTNARGAGPASLGLGVAPPGLRMLTKRNGGSFPQDYVMGVIDGYSRRDHPTAAMPEFGAEGLGPLVQVEEGGISTPIPSDLLALATYLESIQD